MNTVGILVLLPLLAAACPPIMLSENKLLHLGKTKHLLHVHTEEAELLFLIPDADIKGTACFIKTLGTGIDMPGLPKLTHEEVVKLCEIPDYCIKNEKKA